MNATCARCDSPARLYVVVAQSGNIMRVCVACKASRRERTGEWDADGSWAKSHVPVTWRTTTLPAGPRGRR